MSDTYTVHKTDIYLHKCIIYFVITNLLFSKANLTMKHAIMY